MSLGRLFCAVSFSLFVSLFVLTFSDASANSENSKSSNYQMTEGQFNAGLTLDSCSDNYCAKVSIGDNNAISGVGSAVFKDVANNDPLLQVIIEPGESNLGVLSTTQTASKTMKVKIRNHLTGGYLLQIIGEAPKLDGHTLTALTEQTRSTPGKEQFGINIVKNTTPDVGSDTVQEGDGSTIFGIVDEKYGTPDMFRFVSGDVVARGLTESGQTEYTVSMIVNVANTTPAGHYWSDFLAMVIPSF